MLRKRAEQKPLDSRSITAAAPAPPVNMAATHVHRVNGLHYACATTRANLNSKTKSSLPLCAFAVHPL
ncbi:unnamed protein product [Leptosia nina]|uniref:Uncharacterized protein n=1 Tax=Leptosia nina TaxID=320188 RepID=A0AAV1JQL4_9NEOP